MGILDNKVAIITGASSGIGRAAALLFAAEGAAVVLNARGPAALETCSKGWTTGAARWIGNDGARVTVMAGYYGGLIRGGTLDGYCTA